MSGGGIKSHLEKGKRGTPEIFLDFWEEGQSNGFKRGARKEGNYVFA